MGCARLLSSERQLYVTFVRVDTVGMFCAVVCWWSAVAEAVRAVSHVAWPRIAYHARV